MGLGDPSHDLDDTAPLAALMQQLRQVDRELPEALQAQILAAGSASIPGLIATSFLSDSVRGQTTTNEQAALFSLRQIAAAEKAYAAKNQGHYGGLDEIAKTKLAEGDLAKLKQEHSGYRFEVKLKSKAAGFEATATPAKYGRHGRTSFFVDESGKIRRADKNGQPATAEDEAVLEKKEKEQ